MRILKIKTFICVQLFLTLIKLGMRIIGEKDNYNTVDFSFNLCEHKLLKTYRMLLRLCIKLRCIV